MASSLSSDLTKKSAAELIGLVRSRVVSPVEIVEAHLRQIEKINPKVNAVVTVAENALERAREVETALMEGQDIGPLAGLPITIKDTIDTAGLRTTRGSRLFAQHVPAIDATVVERLKSAGAIILGKTNTPEMAIPYETDNPVFGRTNNPYAPDRTCGGSSGGEAAAITACLSSAGIGSDLSGSIRVPAHFCGIAGLKPTTGRVPVDGHVPAVTGVLSLGACIGPIARRVADVALLFSVIADPTQFEISEGPERKTLVDREDLRGRRVAWYADDGASRISAEIREAIESAAAALSDFGVEVVPEAPPGVSKGSKLWIELFSRAAADEIVSVYRGREEVAGPLVGKLLREINDEPSDFEHRIKKAERLADAVLAREKFREELLGWMKATPLLLAPVGATSAFPHGANRVEVGGEPMSVFRAFSYSQTFNVLGFPAMSVPAGRDAQGLPVGVQVIGRPFEEHLVFAAAAVVEEACRSDK